MGWTRGQLISSKLGYIPRQQSEIEHAIMQGDGQFASGQSVVSARQNPFRAEYGVRRMQLPSSDTQLEWMGNALLQAEAA